MFVSITAQRFDLTLGVQRDFNLRRLGMLTLDVRCVDILIALPLQHN